jgi:hypothetical protein
MPLVEDQAAALTRSGGELANTYAGEIVFTLIYAANFHQQFFRLTGINLTNLKYLRLYNAPRGVVVGLGWLYFLASLYVVGTAAFIRLPFYTNPSVAVGFMLPTAANI